MKLSLYQRFFQGDVSLLPTLENNAVSASYRIHWMSAKPLRPLEPYRWI